MKGEGNRMVIGAVGVMMADFGSRIAILAVDFGGCNDIVRYGWKICSWGVNGVIAFGKV